MSIPSRAILAISLTSMSSTALADEQVFRCLEENGRVSFQHTQCTGEGETVELQPVQGGWVDLRVGEKTLLQSYRKRDEERKQRSRKIALTPKPVETTSCWNKRKQLGSISADLRSGHTASEAQSLRRKREAYSEYLRKFCPK